MHGQSPNLARPERISAEEFRALHKERKKPRALREGQRKWTSKVNTNEPSSEFHITLPFLPPSVNKLFSTVRDTKTGVTKRVLTRQARKIRKLIHAMVNDRLNEKLLYELEVEIHLNAFTKKGTVRKVDLTNRVKFLEDSICDALGIDDSHIFRVLLIKKHNLEEKTVLHLHQLRDNPMPPQPE
ncbi:RusA family crossover junction endodeoxyribonuclease [Planctomycetota bacterium]|nr:RusA family crossover junction endodeoxyribonuclease [Planctomycetota bacterium]